MAKELKDVLKEIKTVDDNVQAIIEPLLKDTISDYKKVYNKLIFVIVLLILGLMGTILYYTHELSKQTDKYNEFLSQFEFESDEYIYQETDDYSVINSGIDVEI